MTALYVLEVLLLAAAAAGLVWARRAGDVAWRQHQLDTGRMVEVTIVADTSGIEAAFRQAAVAMQRFARAMTPRRPCGCPECAEHTRDCPDHPLNAGLRSAWRWRSRELAQRWHRWRARRLIAVVNAHESAAYGGRWRR